MFQKIIFDIKNRYEKLRFLKYILHFPKNFPCVLLYIFWIIPHHFHNFFVLGDVFYIISEGTVTVTKRKENKEEEIRKLTKGEYFGEQVK